VIQHLLVNSLRDFNVPYNLWQLKGEVSEYLAGSLLSSKKYLMCLGMVLETLTGLD